MGVISLGGAPLAAPTAVTPLALGGVVHLFVVSGYQGVEEDSEKLLLTDELLRAVLAEAQVVCVSQPFLIAGDLNADPGLGSFSWSWQGTRCYLQV